MPIEIERKFLIKNNNWTDKVSHSSRIRQGYFAQPALGAFENATAKASLRVRIDGAKANINIKSATLDMSRMEYEYEIPMKDALEMLDQLCEMPQIDKTRYRVPHQKHVWEIDKFYGDNAGLVVAEIELSSEHEDYAKPDWLGQEVTDDARYYNVCLINRPYKNW